MSQDQHDAIPAGTGLPANDSNALTTFGHYRQIAQALRDSEEHAQIEAAISSILAMPEIEQITFLKTLAKEHTEDAADVLLALHTFGSLKEVRKEARRSLIRLEAANIYPVWEPPSFSPLDVLSFPEIQQELDKNAAGQALFSGALPGLVGLTPFDAIVTFLTNWSQGNYEGAYDLLASASPLRGDLSKREWAQARRQWSAEVHASNLYITFLQECSDESSEQQKVMRVGWSLELVATPASNPPAELPQATIAFQGTGRHWFLTSYTFIQEANTWRIQSMADEGMHIMQLSQEELQERLQETYEQVEQKMRALEEEEGEELEDEDLLEEEDEESLDEDEEDEEDEDEDDFLESDFNALEFSTLMDDYQELMSIATLGMHYCDALIAHEPLTDFTTYDTAYQQAAAIQDSERAAAYSQLMVERFPAQQGEALRKLAIALVSIANKYDQGDNDERIVGFIEKAEEALRASVAIDHAPMGSIMLAETLIAQNKHFDEATALLHDALPLTTDINELSLIEAGLAKIAQHGEKTEQALKHYQRVAELSPDFPGVWFNIAHLQNSLQQYTQARESFRRSIETEPELTRAYGELAELYVNQEHNLSLAQEVLEEGLELNPEAADLLAALTLIYLENNDFNSAREYLEEAEELDPELEAVQQARQIFNERIARRKKPAKSKTTHRKKR
ncbi:tetratricopeptide repeat protein [Ktedonosporobacter rubrisoli]|uniref:Tetratricopeptide repeat protein n=1 Tax=Ktedonosporobacter rubrisoli TaxID=2509675 RepID=A0A4P6K1V6_KTERU|nr:tetratricopeptide repeat protein [Ktedonosporobacter rubrisoli]QBD81862.1 tetratricopeptide repeat protein [Ktedonosporobacter rubrisoli]